MPGSAYNAPLTGASVGQMPLFTWDEVPGAESYFVLVSRDPNFTTIVDYAFTLIPAYSPRRSPSQSIGYADETTLYYWAVLPADNADGTGVSTEPALEQPAELQQAVDAADAHKPDRRRGGEHSGHRVPVVAGLRRAPLPPPGRPEPDLLEPDRRHRHRLDGVHEQHDLPVRHNLVLARAGRRREQHVHHGRPHVVAGRDVHEAAAEARPRPGQPDERLAPADHSLEHRARRGLLRHPPGRARRRHVDVHQHPGSCGDVHQADRGRRRDLAGSCELPHRLECGRPRPLLADRDVHAHHPGACQRGRGDGRPATALQLGPAPARRPLPSPGLHQGRLPLRRSRT